MTISTLKLALCAVSAAAALAGCGGGGGDDGGSASTTTTTTTTTTAPGSQVPNSALQSVSALIAYMNGLISNSTTSTGEPVLLGDVRLPTSDTTEPSN
ncbi:MAG TPA: hypothetical protein VHL79_18570 [Ramlibacter sp.]|jgi:ABC-type glycerol-3-phosphate transport system substrate-binding protein|nr:hypothetical protein [Ramlibacter sp.]